MQGLVAVYQRKVSMLAYELCSWLAKSLCVFNKHYQRKFRANRKQYIEFTAFFLEFIQLNLIHK